MRILEINKFNHIRGGADRHFVDLVNLLETNKNEVAIFAMSHPENKHSEFSKYFISRVDYDNGSIFNKLKGVFRIFWSFEARRKISKILDEFRPDVVHIHNIYHQISPSILPEIKRRGIPIVMTVHDWKLVCPNYLLNCGEDLCEKCIFGNYCHCIAKKCVKNSYFKSLISAVEMYFHRMIKVYEKNIDLYIAPSQFVKDRLTRAGFPKNNIRVLPHFIEAKSRQISEQSGENYALYFGRVSKEKNADELIEIFKNLPTKLILAGHKDADLKIPNHPNIRYVGSKNSIELEKLIQNSQFVVSASRLSETFGLIALESLKNKKAFIGYDTGAYGEIVESNVNGYLAKNQKEFKEKIIEFSSGKIPKFQFQADKFSPEHYYERIIDIFRLVC